MPDGLLTGFAIPMILVPADHTYVTSSEGHNWPCWGRSSGGRPICSGRGNVLKADCLSRPDSRAGVDYGYSGVCHQTANRILLPAGVVVSAARKAIASFFAYGVYGLDLSTLRHYDPVDHPWPELAECENRHTHL